MKNKNLLMIALLCFQTLIMSKSLVPRKFKGINDLAFELNKGVEDDVWKKGE